MPDTNQEKTAWDKSSVIIQAIAQLAIVVSIVALWVGAKHFKEQQKATAAQALDQQKAAAAQALDQQRQDTLSGYIDSMSDLVLKDNLTKSKIEAPVRAIAVALTDSASRNLDGIRKGTLIRYLWQARLIDRPHPVISLNQMDLNRAKLRGATLFNAVLSGASLFKADLADAKLMGTDFKGSYMRKSNLTSAHLECYSRSGSKIPACADLSLADLSDAVLVGAKMAGARVERAFLVEANLEGAGLQGSDMAESDLSSTDLGCFYSTQYKVYSTQYKVPVCADLTDADLSYALLRNAVLVGANLTAARLTGAYLKKARYNSKPIRVTDTFGHTFTVGPTKWPRGFDVSATGAVCVDC